jgi:membrane associated rhomboid family serine protease
MSENLFKVVFRGEVGFDFEEDEVKANLQQMSGFSREKVDRLFSGQTHVLKKDVDREAAGRLCDALVRVGALAEIEPMTISQPAAGPRPAGSAATRGAAPFSCPACGFVQEKGEACISCGIFFARYEAVQKRRAEALQAELHGLHPESPAAAESAGRLARPRFDCRFPPAAQALLGAAIVALLQSYFCGRQLEPTGFLILVALFLLLIFAAAFSGRDLPEVFAENLSVSVEHHLRVDRRQQWWPFKVTYALVLANILLYYALASHLSPATMTDYLAFFPARPTGWSVPLSALVAPFLHVGGSQLWGGILFFWAVGMVLEPRLGSLRFLCCFLGLGIVAGVFGGLLHQLLFDSALHGFGPAGAVAGLLGLCITGGIGPVLTFSLPLLGALSLVYPLGVEVRFNTLALLWFFIYSGLAGGFGPQHSFSTALGAQLVNLAGLLGGMLLGRLLPIPEATNDPGPRRKEPLRQGSDCPQPPVPVQPPWS